MNKHLKPGVAVDVRGASDEDVQAVIEACKKHGASRNQAHGSNKGEFVVWDDYNDVWICRKGSKDYPIISISQALGRESEVDCSVAKTRDSIAEMHKGVNAIAESLIENTWFERGELPPVGAKVKLSCHEFDKCHDFEFDGTEAEILLRRTTDNGNKVAVFVSEHGDYHALAAHCFRPLKTEKEKFVERFVDEVHEFADLAGVFYDKGLRFTE